MGMNKYISLLFIFSLLTVPIVSSHSESNLDYKIDFLLEKANGLRENHYSEYYNGLRFVGIQLGDVIELNVSGEKMYFTVENNYRITKLKSVLSIPTFKLELSIGTLDRIYENVKANSDLASLTKLAFSLLATGEIKYQTSHWTIIDDILILALLFACSMCIVWAYRNPSHPPNINQKIKKQII